MVASAKQRRSVAAGASQQPLPGIGSDDRIARYPGVEYGELTLAKSAQHARRVTFTHPALKKELTITAPFPQDFKDAFRVLGFEEP